MSQHWRRCAITGMALWALSASGCSLAINPSEYEPAPGTEPDARQPGSAPIDAAGGASYMDAQGLPDAACEDAQPYVNFSDCFNAAGTEVLPSQMRFTGFNNDTWLHLIGHYKGNPGSPRVTVIFNYPGSNVLVLSGYESITWNVALSPPGSLDKIYLVGVNPQMGNMPLGVPVEMVGVGSAAGCGYELPTSIGNTTCNTENHIEFVRARTNLPGAPLSYSGCYQAPATVSVMQSCSNQ